MILMAREMVESRTLYLWGNVAAQIYLDIHHVLHPGCEKGFTDLQNVAQGIAWTVKDTLSFHKSLHVDT